MTLYRSRQQFIHCTRAGHIASVIVNIVIIVTGTWHPNNQYQQHLNSNWQTLMYIDIYSVTHTIHSLNGSKSHTVRETQS